LPAVAVAIVHGVSGSGGDRPAARHHFHWLHAGANLAKAFVRTRLMTPEARSGLDLLATAVMLVDGKLIVQYMNPAAENLF
jgi:hypothetical protein